MNKKFVNIIIFKYNLTKDYLMFFIIFLTIVRLSWDLIYLFLYITNPK